MICPARSTSLGHHREVLAVGGKQPRSLQSMPHTTLMTLSSAHPSLLPSLPPAHLCELCQVAESEVVQGGSNLRGRKLRLQIGGGGSGGSRGVNRSGLTQGGAGGRGGWKQRIRKDVMG